MKKVWKVIGEMEASDLEAADGCKFILEFFEEGDVLHATHGGPWQYKGDAFLVEAIEARADPSSALFTHVLMWVQFHDIPFYLLTKELVSALGNRIDTTIMIDKNARGSIYDKFLRTRVQLPLYLVLQRWIKLEVHVHIRYGRFPNFCLFVVILDTWRRDVTFLLRVEN
jgi:cytochrome c